MHMIRKGQLRTTGELRPAQQFNSLAVYTSSSFHARLRGIQNLRQNRSGSIAALCKELRTEPQSIGILKRPRGFSIRRVNRPDVLRNRFAPKLSPPEISSMRTAPKGRALRLMSDLGLRIRGALPPLLPPLTRRHRPSPRRSLAAAKWRRRWNPRIW